MNKDLAKLLSRLTALKNNLPTSKSVEEMFVVEYQSIIVGIESVAGEDLDEFKIGSDKVRPHVLGHSPHSGYSYSQNKYCDRAFLLTKIDGVLGYFTLMLQPEEVKNQFGFNVEER